MSTTAPATEHHAHGRHALEETANRELALIRQLLSALLAAERYDILQIVTGNFDYRESVLQDSPSSRGKRLIVPRYGQGGDSVPLTTTPIPVLEKNEGRLGGVIVNAGASAAILYLATIGDLQQLHNRPAVWLAASGGTWDFRLGSVLYGGSVCAAAAAATSSLSVAEF